jgi:uncharacterized Rmd1/YagE family protein
MYHLPLLPGYGPNTNVRSSAPPKPKKGNSILTHLSEAEENGYQDTYFTSEQVLSPPALKDRFMSPNLTSRKSTLRIASPPHVVHHYLSDADPNRMTETEAEAEDPGFMTEPEPFSFSSTADRDLSGSGDRRQGNRDSNSHLDPGMETDPGTYGRSWKDKNESDAPEDVSKGKEKAKEEDVAEVVFFDYGVVVFFGLEERQEMDILDDLKMAGIVKRVLPAKDWEIEEFHYTVCCPFRSISPV